MNLMTEPGETDGHTAADHLMAIRRHAPTMPIHDILVNTAPFTPEQIGRYGAQGAVPVAADLPSCARWDTPFTSATCSRPATMCATIRASSHARCSPWHIAAARGRVPEP